MKNVIRFPLAALAPLAIFVLTSASAVAAAPASMAASPVVLTTDEAQAVKDFEAQLKDYLALHRRLEATLPKLSKKATPAQCDQNQRSLGALIRTARPQAKQGDFFSAGMHALAMRAVASALTGPGGPASKNSITDDNPELPGLRVNDRYPETLPLSTMPLLVLSTLPKLEEGLEYRFAGNRLVLMDTHADLVIDYTENVLP